MTFLLILGVFIALAIINICIGFKAAIKLAPTIAQINTSYEYKESEKEWMSRDEEIRWVREGWQPSPLKDKNGKTIWKETGATRGGYTLELDRSEFKAQMGMLRFWGVFYIPVVLSRKDTLKAVEIYDHEVAKAKQAVMQKKIDELEASDKKYRETGIII